MFSMLVLFHMFSLNSCFDYFFIRLLYNEARVILLGQHHLVLEITIWFICIQSQG